MSRAIWKFPLKITDAQHITAPAGAKIIAVQMQGDTLCLWAIVNPDAPTKRIEIRVHGTGHPLPVDADYDHIGTVQASGGALVWHVFRVIGTIELVAKSFAL